MLELTQFQLPNQIRLFAKLEYLNPGGSIKDRLGIELVNDGFRCGKLKAGGTTIEPSRLYNNERRLQLISRSLFHFSKPGI